MIDLERTGDVFVLTMNVGENRWNTSFVRAYAEALDEVEYSTGAAALVTASADAKFFSNGLDLDWVQDPDAHPEGGPREVFGAEFMALAARVMTLPIPTVAAVNGHAFGAGFMIALCHDERVMREDRGYLCANEIEIGMRIPEPELALFKHKMPASAFAQTVLLARRWTGPDAREAGIVQQIAALDEVREQAIARAALRAPLGNNRAQLGWMKEHIYGENAAINGVHGAAYMLRHPDQFAH